MKFLEALRRRPKPVIEPSDVQIARIAAKVARSFVARDADFMTPQTKGKVLRDIAIAEQTDIARAKTSQEI